jgi:hypothetical protein
MNNLKERWNAKTPKFWKRVQKIAITAGAIAAVVLSAPISLPTILITTAGYVIAAGTVAATLSQLTIKDNQDEEEN